MVRYEIGPWEGGQKNEQTHRQTNRQRLANYNIDWYIINLTIKDLSTKLQCISPENT